MSHEKPLYLLWPTWTALVVFLFLRACELDRRVQQLEHRTQNLDHQVRILEDSPPESNACRLQLARLQGTVEGLPEECRRTLEAIQANPTP